MKTLLLIRHAKSSWDDTALHDRDRPLAARGQRDAATMGQRLAQRRVKPDLILSSPAARALATAQLVAEGLGYRQQDIEVSDRLYATTVDALIGVVEDLDDSLECVMLVGHNPEFTDLAHRFAREITRMPTCAIAGFRFETGSWTGIGQTKPVSADLDSPKTEPGERPEWHVRR